MPHIHEKIDFTVEVFVVYKNKVLLRLHDKYNMWFSVGGHIELDEDPNTAAIREVKEEVGLDIVLDTKLQDINIQEPHYKTLIPPVSLNMHSINEVHQHVTVSYFATTDSDTIIPEKPTDQWKWLTAQEVEAMDLRPDIKHYALRALKELGK